MSGVAAVDEHRAVTRTIAAPTDRYAGERSATEYERLRQQARVWEDATLRIFDRVGLGPGARCLDAGCGPGETMRLMAERVGPTGRVTGIDLDAPLGAQAIGMLRGAGHRHCEFARVDLRAGLLAEAARDAEQHSDRPLLFPLMIGAWKRKAAA
jgi:SAM-dependent methyltransferase